MEISPICSHLFLNLISNAIKFSNKQPVINIWGEAHDGMVSIYVEDNGIGIEEAGHQKIFHAFQKMHGKNEYEGSGLGLSICKRIVDIHHGHLSVSSVPGEGSTFLCRPARSGRREIILTAGSDMFQKLIDNKKLGGVNCIIWKDGQIVYQESCWVQEFGDA